MTLKLSNLLLAATVGFQGVALARTPVSPAADPVGQWILSTTAPYIDGVPGSTAAIGRPYSFEPLVSDPNDDPLELSVTNLPRWAGFDPATGEISGTPGPEDTGTWGGIRIAATDGRESTAMAPFQIVVAAGGACSASVQWLPPVTTATGATMRGLAGYRIYYGRDPAALTDSVDVPNPGISRFVIDNLDPGLYYVSVAAFDIHGNIGRPSPQVPAFAS
ncbi:MAG: hypothetical protein J0M16_02825 [Gammaproteobacteria bacterium]|nr:hypothetical protein [Gammaproteobacteria bacterium]